MSRLCPLSIVKPEHTSGWVDKYSQYQDDKLAYCITNVTDVTEYIDDIMDSAYTPYSYCSIDLPERNSLYTSDISEGNTPDMKNFNFGENISNKSYHKKICDSPCYRESKELFCLATHKYQMNRICKELKHRVCCVLCGEGKDPDKLEDVFCSSICGFIAKNNFLGIGY